MAVDLYTGHGSPYGWRVWLALELKKVAHDVKILSFQAGDTRKPEFVALNPRHTVPTIVDDGHVLWESLAILEYLDERYDTGTKLYPGDAKNRARIRRLIQEMEGYLDKEGIDPITHEYFGKELGTSDRLVRNDQINTGRTSVSEDGRLMVLPRYELDAGGLWTRDLRTGQERQLAATPRTPLNPVMSADGQWVAYTVTKVVTGGDAGYGDVLIVPSAGGVPRKVCENCQAAAWVRTAARSRPPLRRRRSSTRR